MENSELLDLKMKSSEAYKRSMFMAPSSFSPCGKETSDDGGSGSFVGAALSSRACASTVFKNPLFSLYSSVLSYSICFCFGRRKSSSSFYSLPAAGISETVRNMQVHNGLYACSSPAATSLAYAPISTSI